MNIIQRRAFLKLVLPLLLLVTTPFSGCVQKKLASTTEDQWFQMVVLPDTQYYTAERHGGKVEMFEQQIEWILQNYKNEKIAYVAHVGDISDHGEEFPIEWERAKNVMYRLEKPLPGLPHGIPYGLAVGNHDTTPNGAPKKLKTGYEASFGRDRFLGRNYYGGSIKDSNLNDNHYDLFSAGGQDFIVLYLTYNEPGKKNYDPDYEKEVLEWGGKILEKYKDRKAIIVSHSILRKPGNSNSNYIPGEGNKSISSNFTPQGKVIYNYFKEYPNVFITLSGHISGEGFRAETYNGKTIKMYLADYQSRRNPPYEEKDRNGGNGLMRLMKFNLTKETLSVRTLAPRKDGKHIWEEDEDSMFTHSLYR
jgi:hypothetical protein